MVVSERRPIPLYRRVLVGTKLVSLFGGTAPTARKLPGERGAKVNRELLKVSHAEATRVRDDSRRLRRRSGQGKRSRDSGSFDGDVHSRFAGHRTSRTEVARVLEGARLLPAIRFIFSRAGCDAAVEQLLTAGVSLTTRTEAALLGEIADRYINGLSVIDLDTLGYEDFRGALCAGITAHHAG